MKMRWAEPCSESSRARNIKSGYYQVAVTYQIKIVQSPALPNANKPGFDCPEPSHIKETNAKNMKFNAFPRRCTLWPIRVMLFIIQI